MRRYLVALLVAGALLATPAATGLAAGPPVITWSCSPAPADCSGWFTTDVTITWVASNVTSVDCPPVAVTADTPGRQLSCTAYNGQNVLTATVTIKLDKTPAQVTGATPARSPDANGWYDQPVGVVFSGGDATSGIASCTAATYAGPDSAAAALAGTCRDNAGNVSAPTSFGLKFDATPPSVSAVPARPPDSGGWYNHAVPVQFSGSDGLSGLDSCSSTTYGGPDNGSATVTGSCRDKAGNTASGSFLLKYDGTPPSLTKVQVEAGNRFALLRWQASADTHRVDIVRSPGVGRALRSTIYRGDGRSFRDARLKNGVRYRYTIAGYDAAGNAADKVVAAVPMALSSPAPGARLTAPPLLAWSAVGKATYYNVQLFRGGRKILSTWPLGTRLRLARTWVYEGRRYRLTPGRYRWYVWPGLGRRSAARYGPLLGQSDFVVKRG